MTNWIKPNDKPREEIEEFESFQLYLEGWKRASIGKLNIKEIVDGPYLIKQNGIYYCGNESVWQKLEGKERKWIQEFIEKITTQLEQSGLSIQKIFGLTFQLVQESFWALEIFGGKFLKEKTECPATLIQTSILF